MQTFLPYTNFDECARVLDTKRLGKQRVEGYQILRTLSGVTPGWRNHPAVKMWRGYEAALALYTITVCKEWQSRGYADTLLAKVSSEYLLPRIDQGVEPQMPSWLLGDESEKLTLSHRSNLLRKDFLFYMRYGWNVPIDLDYYWPMK
jgi:hypothetical protein